MKQQYYKGLFVLLGGVLVLTGCLPQLGSSGSKSYGATDGGVYKSIDGGVTWKQVVDVNATKGQVKQFVNEDVRPIVLDPQDHEAIFAGTNAIGLISSVDGANSWTLDKFIKNTRVVSVAIDYKDRCKWVVAQATKISRTLDCGRGWRDMLTETRTGYGFRVVLTDHFNRNVLYAANTKEVLKSLDYGETWQTMERFNSEITDLVMDAKDSRKLYVGFFGGGMSKTVDGGLSWEDMSEGLSEFNGGKQVKKITQSLSADNTFYLVTKHGLLRTTDGGVTYTALPLLTPAGAVEIWSFAVHPTDDNVMWYGTDTTLYKSIDNGKTWKTTKLPTTRRPTWLTVDFKDGNVLYLGTRRPE
ncbi:hypothetical protein IT409_01770 [Candidatus Falkowbacteria bacterium]|nr:hypothetical protein [Candidatus Falkowbacteria bacterium]